MARVAYREAGVTYLQWDADDVVSEAHHRVLTGARRAGVPVAINDGRRTMALQQARYNTYLRGGPLAARPSSTAPHIMRGREDHALDQQSSGIGRLMAYYRRRGVRCGLTVPGESWHMGLTGGERELLSAARRLTDPLQGYTSSERRWIREYDDLLEDKRRGRDSRRKRRRRGVLRRVMTRQRKAIYRVANKSRGGWERSNRRKRYASLLARTR
jgi:hypothetical protein